MELASGRHLQLVPSLLARAAESARPERPEFVLSHLKDNAPKYGLRDFRENT